MRMAMARSRSGVMVVTSRVRDEAVALGAHRFTSIELYHIGEDMQGTVASVRRFRLLVLVRVGRASCRPSRWVGVCRGR
jgi:hypothetical protein